MSIYEFQAKSPIKDNILKIVADKQAIDILTYLIDKPRSITEISYRFKIPKSSAYRRIHELESLGLVRVSGSLINERGRRSYIYASKVKSAKITITKDGLEVDIEPNKVRNVLLY